MGLKEEEIKVEEVEKKAEEEGEVVEKKTEEGEVVEKKEEAETKEEPEKKEVEVVGDDEMDDLLDDLL